MYYDDHYLYDSFTSWPKAQQILLLSKRVKFFLNVIISIMLKDFILRDELFENVIFKHK